MARHARLIAAALATSAIGGMPGLAQTVLPQAGPVQGGVAQPMAPSSSGLAQTFLGPGSAGTVGGASPGQEGAVSTLLDQANYWRLQNRPELVLRTLERVLVVDSRNVDALAGAAQAQAQLGNRQAAEGFLGRLRQVAPNDPRLSDTDITVRAQTVDQGALVEARRLAQAGRAGEAAQRYRELFRGAAPPDAYAQEYYATLAGTDQGYPEARDGLARLSQRSPNDTRLQLVYAQVLTYRDTTRGDGIGRLRQLAANPEVNTAATTAWRQALLWQGPSREIEPELKAFLQRFPNDAQVAAKLNDVQNPPLGPPDESGMSRIRGFEQLNAGRLREAQREFETAVGRNAEDADATGGLGLVRLREGKFGEARILLERAIRLAPEKREQWQRALDGAAYAAEIAAARSQLQAGNLDAAEQSLRRATARESGDRADADALLGDLALRRGDMAGAEARYRAALARRPNLGVAASGLYEVLQQQGRFAEAEDLQRRAGNAMASGDVGAGRANAIRTEAQRATDPATAIAMLRQAQQLNPVSPWIKLDLARLLARQGRAAEARAILEGAGATSPESLYAAALFADEDNRPADAAGLMNRIPVRLRNNDMNRLLTRAKVALDVQRAASLWRNGQRTEARTALFAIAGRPDPTGASGQLAVRALGQLNDPAGAAEAGRTAMAANAQAAPAAKLGLAGALLTAGAEQEAVQLARVVEGLPNLSGEERRQSIALQSGLAVRVADRLNEQGDQATAYEALAPVLARDPANPVANLALARLYQGANQPQQASLVAEGVLQADPRSMDARFAAVDAAIAGRDWQRAEALLVEARALDPNEPRVPLLEARLARASGNTARALRALELAAQQRRAQVIAEPTVIASAYGTPVESVSANPFRRVARPGATSGPIAQGGDPLASEIQRELAVVREETTARLQGGMGFRSRTGTGGLDRLDEYSAPIDASIGAGRLGGRLTATMTPVSISTGKLDGSTADSLRSFGSNALSIASNATNISAATRERLAPRDTTASGVGLGLGYTRGGVTVDVGTSPVGFRQQHVLGGVELVPALSNSLRLRLAVEQRSVTDSLLSWSGARDTTSGRTWGGVVRTGGRAQLEYTAGPVGLYAGGGYYAFSGENTARNSRYEAGAGVSYAVWREPGDELQAGLDIVYFAYDKNQRLFTFGNGGYFSPQSYFALNVPVDWRGRNGDLSYRLGGTIGYQRYQEDSAKYFPNDPAAQAQLEASLSSDTTGRSMQPSRSESGIGGGVRGDIEYSVTPNLRIGGLLRYDRTANWNETRGLVFARYRFDR